MSSLRHWSDSPYARENMTKMSEKKDTEKKKHETQICEEAKQSDL